MKHSTILTAMLFVFAFTITAQEDTMFILKDGLIVAQYNVHTEIDSILFYNPFLVQIDSFVDSRDGIKYMTVIIGTQEWMSENLRFLPNLTSPGMSSQTIPYCYVYQNTGGGSNLETYGVLYNWPAAMSGSASSTAVPSGVTGVCPTGWHLPSHEEWEILTDYLGGAPEAGGKLKENGLDHWISPNAGATNVSGFTALPGGMLGNNGTFSELGIAGYWWSATSFDTTMALSRNISYLSASINSSFLYEKKLGFSVRCVKD
ncbi:MAG: hypothetical protein K9I34_02840 [Bacteroidales bacterium]|nr:hypothetical protein [Bacteroidales bacterium]